MTRLEAELVLQADVELAECPLWDPPRKTLLWVEMMTQRLHRFDPILEIDQVVDVGRPLSAVCLGDDGLILAVDRGFARLDGDGRVTPIADVVGRAPVRMNDGACDPQGRFWAGTAGLDLTGTAGALYRLDPDLTVTMVLSGIGVSNGLDWTSDGQTAYFVDSLAGGVDTFDFDATRGWLMNRRRFVDIPNNRSVGGVATVADGLCVDADDHVWVAIYGAGEVRRFSPDGGLEAVVSVPALNTSSCAFGGDALSELYITAGSRSAADPKGWGGSLFRCQPGPKGRPQPRFGG